MKISVWPLAAFGAAAALIGCGGGGGGGNLTTGGSSTGTTTGFTTGITTGSTTGGTATTLSGRVVPEGLPNQGIGGVDVKIFSGAGIVIASGVTASDGTFRIVVTPSAARFHLANIPAGYYQTYFYRGKVYTTLDPACSAPLPPIVEGSDTPLLESVRVPDLTYPPPPPPTGCQ